MDKEKDLFGNIIISEEMFRVTYDGDSFNTGAMSIRSLYTELKSLEELLNESISILIETGKLGVECENYDLLIELEKGSFSEKIKLIFRNKKTYTALTFILPFLVATYTYYLNKDENGRVLGEYAEEIQLTGDNNKFKNNLSNILSPLSGNDDCVLINNGEINININYDQKKEIVKNIKEPNIEKEYVKNGVFEENFLGTIRKIDLDASKNNYFGFNIDNGPSKIPTSIKGEFNLLDYKEIIDAPIKIRANVKYMEGVIKHIEILSYELLETKKQTKINF